MAFLKRSLRHVVAASLMFAAVAGAQEDSKYVRVQDAEDGDKRLLQVAVRTMEPLDLQAKERPLIHLVGVVHIGDLAYYKELQGFLDAQGLVLYEGVKPEAPGGDGEAEGGDGDDESRSRVTASRQRSLAVLVAQYRREHKRLPSALADVVAAQDGLGKTAAEAALRDGWGRPHMYEILTNEEGKKRFDIISTGADKERGGAGAAADIHFTSQKPLTKREVDAAGEGIQTQLAAALGLEFQLHAIDYSNPAWRNSDMSIDEVQRRLAEKGADGAIFQMMDGSSAMAKFGASILKMIGQSEEMSFMARLMMVEVLAHADTLMKAQEAELGALMEVIIVDRNTAVLEDLREVMDGAKETAAGAQAVHSPSSIALFYGAGHLPDLEARLEADFGYRFKETRWLTAVNIDLGSVPGGRSLAHQVRQMMKAMKPTP